MLTNTAWLIYLETGMLLSRREFRDWREIQERYRDIYTANLSPMTAEELIEYFTWDFREETAWPFSRREILDFFAGTEEELFRGSGTDKPPSGDFGASHRSSGAVPPKKRGLTDLCRRISAFFAKAGERFSRNHAD